MGRTLLYFLFHTIRGILKEVKTNRPGSDIRV